MDDVDDDEPNRTEKNTAQPGPLANMPMATAGKTRVVSGTRTAALRCGVKAETGLCLRI